MIIRSYDPRKRKTVPAGTYDTTTMVFLKKVQSIHYMIKEKGYGISEDVVEQLRQLLCEKIQIQTKNSLYEFSFNELLEAIPQNYGSGKQRFLKTLNREKI